MLCLFLIWLSLLRWWTCLQILVRPAFSCFKFLNIEVIYLLLFVSKLFVKILTNFEEMIWTRWLQTTVYRGVEGLGGTLYKSVKQKIHKKTKHIFDPCLPMIAFNNLFIAGLRVDSYWDFMIPLLSVFLVVTGVDKCFCH